MKISFLEWLAERLDAISIRIGFWADDLRIRARKGTEDLEMPWPPEERK